MLPAGLSFPVSVRTHLDGDDTVVVIALADDPDPPGSATRMRAVAVLDGDELRNVRRRLHTLARYVVPSTDAETLYLFPDEPSAEFALANADDG